MSCPKMSRAELRGLVLNEVRGSISTETMLKVLERLPAFLRSALPHVGSPVIRGGVQISVFDPVQQFVKYPPIFRRGPEISFGLHLGDGFRGLVPSEDELREIRAVISDWAGARGWYVAGFGTGDGGGRADVVLLPRDNPRVEPSGPMFHITDSTSLPSILARGLRPKRSETRGYEPRVYVFANRQAVEGAIQDNAEAWSLGWNAKLTSTPDIVVLELDPTLFRKGTKFELDPEYDEDYGALFTKSHIPPEAIVRAERVEMT